MSYYDTFIKASRTPAQQHRENLQELVNYSFDNASTYYTDVEEEVAFGTLQFVPKNVRVNTIVDAKTGQRVNDDYKKIIFSDNDYAPSLGTRYRFEDNIWITFSTDNLKTDTSGIYVRRCNNTINTQDAYGNIHREPCYVDYKVTETQPFLETKIDIPKGRIWIQYQYNDWTKNIDINDRYIFGKITYKVREFHSFDRKNTFDNNTLCIGSFYADNDEIAPDDNFEFGIANYKNFDYIINAPSDIIGTINTENTIPYTTLLNGQERDIDVIFESSDENIASVNSSGVISYNNIGECDILIKVKNNDSIKDVIHISVEDNPVYVNKDVIEPNITSIKLNKTQNYSVYEYVGTNKQSTKFDIMCYDVPEKNYVFNTDGNNFSITNLKSTENYLLRVVCTNKNTNNATTLYIKLGGLF